jgi:hypothetical protein
MNDVMTMGRYSHEGQPQNGSSNLLLGKESSHAEDLGPFLFGQFQNVIDIGVFSLDQPAH